MYLHFLICRDDKNLRLWFQKNWSNLILTGLALGSILTNFSVWPSCVCKFTLFVLKKCIANTPWSFGCRNLTVLSLHFSRLLKKSQRMVMIRKKKKSIWLCKCSGMKLDKPVKHCDPRPIKFPSIFRCATFKRKEWLECALCSSKIIYLMVLYQERKTCSKRKWHIFCKTSHINLKRFQKRLSKGSFTLLKNWFGVYHIWLGTGISWDLLH